MILSTTLPIIQPICRSTYTFEGYKFTIPPATALIQSLFFSRKLSTVLSFLSQPSSYGRTRLGTGHPVVAWFAWNKRNPTTRAKWQYFLDPYQLALQGFSVVAADYVGLRVEKDASGQRIVHQYLASSSHAHDVFYSVQAARTSFPPELSKHFVIIGNSQGGGARGRPSTLFRDTWVLLQCLQRPRQFMSQCQSAVFSE